MAAPVRCGGGYQIGPAVARRAGPPEQRLARGPGSTDFATMSPPRMAHFRRPRALRGGPGDDGGPRRRHPRRPCARAGLAARASADLHRGHERQGGRFVAAAALSRPCRGPRRAIHLSRAGPARGLCHARPPAAPAGRAPLRVRSRGMDHPHPRPLQRHRRAPAGPGRRLGGAAGSRGQDRRHWRAHPPLGVVPWPVDQPRARPQPLCRHRALRHRPARRDLAGRSRPAGDHDRSRRRAGRDLRRGLWRQSGRRQLRKAIGQDVEVDRLDVDGLDPGHARPALAGLDHLADRAVVADDQRLDCTVAAIAHPAGQAEPPRRGRSPSRGSPRPARGP